MKNKAHQDEEVVIVAEGNLNVLVEKSVFVSNSWKTRKVTLHSDKTLLLAQKKKPILLNDKCYLDITNQSNFLILKLRTGSKSILFKCSESIQCTFWILAFRSIGVRIVKERKSGSKGFLQFFDKEDASLVDEDDILPFSSFDCKDMTMWSEQEVLCFLSFVYVDFGKTLYTVGLGNIFHQSRTTGAMLAHFSPRSLAEEHNVKTAFILALIDEVKKIKTVPSFQFDRYKLIRKISKNENATSLLTFKELREKKILDLYSIKNVMELIPFEKDLYITPECSPVCTAEEINFSSSPMAEFPTSTAGTPSASPPNAFTIAFDTIEMSSPEQGPRIRARSINNKSSPGLSPNKRASFGENLLNMLKRKSSSSLSETIASPHLFAKSMYQLKVKLVLTELPGIPKVVKNITPLLGNFGGEVIGNHYGMFHTAIIIGPWYLEWNLQEWCLPRGAKGDRFKSHKAFFVGDIGVVNLASDEEMKQFQHKISSIIVDWNLNYSYRKAGALLRKANQGNCQDFVQDVLNSIHKYYRPKQNKILDEFMELMKKNGDADPSFFPPKEFAKTFELPNKKIQFATHEELDKFCQKIMRECMMKDLIFDEDFPGEYLLLKAFDRSFHLRHNCNPGDKKYTPHNCCFKDPQQTGSFLYNPREIASDGWDNFKFAG